MRVCFVGLGTSAVGWYRCYLPAIALKQDWVGLIGEPPMLRLETGIVDRHLGDGVTRMPNLADYDVVVIQQPRGNGWLRVIRKLQSQGVKVIYEIDDYVHAIHKVVGHDHGIGGLEPEAFGPEELRRLELTMRVCDAVICSTDYIARRYRKFNRNTFVCENGIDLGRYSLTRPERQRVNIGWAGGTGHDMAMGRWLTALARTLRDSERACFVSVGHDYASPLMEHFPGRTLAVPFTLVDNYPAAMALFDVALAPAARASGGQLHPFFRGKSDLRWVEAGALGIPTIADPEVYPNIEHGVTGFHATSGEEAEELMKLLLDDDKLRTQVGSNAEQYVKEHRTITTTCRQWERVFDEVLAGASSGVPS